MKCFISLFLFLLLSFQVQAQVLVEYDQDIDIPYWQNFISEEHTQSLINYRNKKLSFYGSNLSTIDTLNIAKSDLVRLEQELGLYKQDIKSGLFMVEINKAEEVINRHWENIRNIEEQFQFRAGLKTPTDEDELIRMVKQAAENVVGFNQGMWELYNKDHQILFDLVEKTDENLYKNVLSGDDEAYAQLILPQVEKYTEKTNVMAEAYYNSLSSDYLKQAPLDKFKIADLLKVMDNSLTIYECFLKNFQNNPTGEYQKELKQVIETWYGQQSEWGANSLMEAYKTYGEADVNPNFIAIELNGFRDAPQETVDEIVKFYRENFIYNEDFINAKDISRLGARVDALIGLKYFDALNKEEENLFKKAIEQGVIRPARENSYFGFGEPIK